MTQMKNIYHIHFDIIDSTNTWTKNNAATLDPDQLTCITASEQTAGRGRLSRKWISPKGNIYATLYFTLPRQCPYIINLGQILSLSCIAVLKKKEFNLETAIGDDKLTQSFDPESLKSVGPFTNRECEPPLLSDSESKPCITLPSRTAVSRINTPMIYRS